MRILKEIGAGVLLLETPVFSDDRGSFIKFADVRLNEIRPYEQRQLNYVVNNKRFTCRGLHYQRGEFSESKIFRILQGSVQLVLFNVDSTNPFYRSTYSLTIDHPKLAVWVPRGFATGYCTLADSTAVLYSSDNDYNPEAEAGIRWNDPLVRLDGLTADKLLISEKDMNWPDFQLR